MKKNSVNRTLLMSAALFVLIIMWLVISVGNAQKASDKNRAASLRKSVMNGAALCYSIEGEYPRELEYLEENYGVSVNRELYIVHYEYFGSNICPTVTIIEKGGEAS